MQKVTEHDLETALQSKKVMTALESAYHKSPVSKWTVSSYRPHLIYIHWAYKIFQLAERLQEIIREMFLFWWPSESSPSVSIKHCWAQEKPPAIKPPHLQYPFKQRELYVFSPDVKKEAEPALFLNLCTQVTLMLTSPVSYMKTTQSLMFRTLSSDFSGGREAELLWYLDSL